MLQLKIAITPEGWDEEKEEFVDPQYVTLELEHSLASLQQWESKWLKPFLYTKNLSDEEVLDYIRCMTVTPNVDPVIYDLLTSSHIEQIHDYINAPMTATTFTKDKDGKRNREIITSEIIHYWMVSLQIPHEYRTWHLNQLITFIRVCSIKNAPTKKSSRRDTASHYKALNEARKQKFNTKG